VTFPEKDHRTGRISSGPGVGIHRAHCLFIFISIEGSTAPQNATARNAVENPVMNQAALRAGKIISSNYFAFPARSAFLSATGI
jgi:hypothetical protein